MPWLAHLGWALIAIAGWHQAYAVATSRANRPWVDQNELRHQAAKVYAEIVG